MKQPRLTIELVPKTTWFNNVRSALTTKQWDLLRKDSYKKANYRCEVCNGVGAKHPVECHEIWAFDEESKIQILTGLISLCPSCHEVKHIGLALKKGNGDRALRHLAKVNNWNEQDAEDYAFSAFELHAIRSNQQWTVNIDFITQELPNMF